MADGPCGIDYTSSLGCITPFSTIWAVRSGCSRGASASERRFLPHDRADEDGPTVSSIVATTGLIMTLPPSTTAATSWFTLCSWLVSGWTPVGGAVLARSELVGTTLGVNGFVVCSGSRHGQWTMWHRLQARGRTGLHRRTHRGGSVCVESGICFKSALPHFI